MRPPTPQTYGARRATPTGRVLTGHLTLGQLRRGSGAAPARHSIRFVAPPPPAPAPAKDAGGGGGGGKEGEEAAKDAATKV